MVYLLSVNRRKQEKPIIGACYIALSVPAVQNNTHRLKTQILAYCGDSMFLKIDVNYNFHGRFLL